MQDDGRTEGHAGANLVLTIERRSNTSPNGNSKRGVEERHADSGTGDRDDTQDGRILRASLSALDPNAAAQVGPWKDAEITRHPGPLRAGIDLQDRDGRGRAAGRVCGDERLRRHRARVLYIGKRKIKDTEDNPTEHCRSKSIVKSSNVRRKPHRPAVGAETFEALLCSGLVRQALLPDLSRREAKDG